MIYILKPLRIDVIHQLKDQVYLFHKVFLPFSETTALKFKEVKSIGWKSPFYSNDFWKIEKGQSFFRLSKEKHLDKSYKLDLIDQRSTAFSLLLAKDKNWHLKKRISIYSKIKLREMSSFFMLMTSTDLLFDAFL